MAEDDAVSVSLFSEEASESGGELEEWAYAAASLLRTSCDRDEDVDGHPTYCLRCRVQDFKWTVSKLRFAKWSAFEERVRRHGSLAPDAAECPFPQRLRRQAFGIKLPDEEVTKRALALDAWCAELSKRVCPAPRLPTSPCTAPLASLTKSSCSAERPSLLRRKARRACEQPLPRPARTHSLRRARRSSTTMSASTLTDAAKERQKSKELKKCMEAMLDRLRCRTLVTDGGTEHANFPDEGLCVLKVMGSGGKEIPWPAWLVARGLGTWSGKSTRHFAHKQFERDDGLRSVCCYGSGWQLRVPEAELHDYDPAIARKNAHLGGRLYRAALAEAEARRVLGEDDAELASFSSLVAQNLDECRDPVLLGRLFSEHERRIEETPTVGDVLAVRWNEDDWWPARVVNVDGDDVEVEYDDDLRTRETVVRGDEIWTTDVRCMGDDREATFDAKDAALLDGGDFGLGGTLLDSDDDAPKAPRAPPVYKTDSEEDASDDGRGEPGEPYKPKAKRKAPKSTAVDDAEKKPKKKRPKGEARPKKAPKIHLASEIAVRRAQWSVGARAPVVVEERYDRPPHAEPGEPEIIALAGDPSLPKWKRALLARGESVGIPAPAAVKKPQKPKAAASSGNPPQRGATTMGKARAAAARPSALSLLGAIRAPSAATPRAELPSPAAAAAKLATTNQNHNSAIALAQQKARAVEAAMLNADRAVPPPPPPPAAPAPDSDDDDASFTEADYERPPDEPKPKKKTSSALPPGWVAKWSERKQMYYYVHKARGETRWNKPKDREDRKVKREPSGNRAAPGSPKEESALDAARRTLAALESTLVKPAAPAPPPPPPPPIEVDVPYLAPEAAPPPPQWRPPAAALASLGGARPYAAAPGQQAYGAAAAPAYGAVAPAHGQQQAGGDVSMWDESALSQLDKLVAGPNYGQPAYPPQPAYGQQQPRYGYGQQQPQQPRRGFSQRPPQPRQATRRGAPGGGSRRPPGHSGPYVRRG